MNRRFVSAGLISSIVVFSGCTPSPPAGEATLSELNRLEQRLTKLERELGSRLPSQEPQDPKAPAGPIRSLTLRVGTDDDRLRLYWADGQTSDLICSEEGKGTWACG